MAKMSGALIAILAPGRKEGKLQKQFPLIDLCFQFRWGFNLFLLELLDTKRKLVS